MIFGMRMMSETLSPQKWAFKITHVLNASLGQDHFPIDVGIVAKEYSRNICPDDPVSLVKGASLPGFEGGLFKAPAGEKGWGIIYNQDITSPGRINFTLAHEFGHYLQHRYDYPDGIQCGEQDLYRWDSEYRQIEYQANLFAATLLMPLDDYRRQIDPKSNVDMDMISFVANRYDVSLLAALLRWIEFTEQRAVLVVSRDGFILWARSSKRSFKSGAWIKTTGVPPVPIPANSVAAGKNVTDDEVARKGVKFNGGVWFGDPCEEMAIYSDQYDFVISLIQLPPSPEKPWDEMRVLNKAINV